MDWTQIIGNPWVGFSGALIGVFGIIVSIIFYLRTRRYQKPTYFKRSIRWYDGVNIPHKDISLMFQGKVIPRFTITHLAFWNAGNQTIREHDFAPASPLCLKIPEEIEVFDIRITAVTANEICANLETSKELEAGVQKKILVHFDYLDNNDGFSIQLIHDAESASGIKFSGKLPGVSKFKSSSSDSRERDLFSPLGYSQPFRSYPPVFKWLFIPLVSLGLGGTGIWSIYWALFMEFHWYHIFGGLLIFYLFVPFVVFSEVSPPKALSEAKLD